MIHDTATIDPKAKISSNVKIGPYCVVGPNVEIGDEVILQSHVHVLGKTKIAIDLLYHWLKEEVVDSVLIITKKSLISNWTSELKFHGNMHPLILSSNKAENFERMTLPGYVYLCNYEAIRGNTESFNKFMISALFITLKELNFSSKEYHCLIKIFPIFNRSSSLWWNLYWLLGS